MSEDNVKLTQEQVTQVVESLKGFQLNMPANLFPFLAKVGVALVDAAATEVGVLDFGPNNAVVQAVLSVSLNLLKNWLHSSVVPSPTPAPAPAPGGGTNVDVG